MAAVDPLSPPKSERGHGLLIAGLAMAVMTVSLLQTLVVPVLSRIAQQLDADLTVVSWVLTANLLAAAVATPVLGRMGDVYGRRPVMLGILLTVLVGILLALFTSSLPLLIVAGCSRAPPTGCSRCRWACCVTRSRRTA